MQARRLIATTLCSAAALAALSGCKSKGDIVVDEGVGITAVRSKCPAVGIPDYTGDMTVFGPGAGQTADNIDVVAAMTDVRSQCNEDVGGDKVSAQVSFQVLGRRNDARGARTVTLPYFVSVLQGGSAVTSKRVGQITLNFADGQDRAQATATGTAYVDRAAATLPQDIRERITRKRKAGDADAAVDPLAAPEIKAAVARATFEVLVGFQLTETQLAYNATR
ncbi:hypothetical protein ACFSTD_06265 [Novosphingobium colocasiae]|uniref:Lipoprotein n=1 Tax=Novosphingobium colocasiae TaxID=1256513 RepID=A0A918UGV4_9SPHN|nr:hypothetical protein [Novosphingobium colocasiae]GGZ06244.1 hypothetical protein GCM10011614_21460 [Novosphingobium colocasiae]